MLAISVVVLRDELKAFSEVMVVDVCVFVDISLFDEDVESVRRIFTDELSVTRDDCVRNCSVVLLFVELMCNAFVVALNMLVESATDVWNSVVATLLVIVVLKSSILVVESLLFMVDVNSESVSVKWVDCVLYSFVLLDELRALLDAVVLVVCVLVDIPLFDADVESILAIFSVVETLSFNDEVADVSDSDLIVVIDVDTEVPSVKREDCV